MYPLRERLISDPVPGLCPRHGEQLPFHYTGSDEPSRILNKNKNKNSVSMTFYISSDDSTIYTATISVAIC
jgi:hypothetical protein